jgi:hypothetical protein
MSLPRPARHAVWGSRWARRVSTVLYQGWNRSPRFWGRTQMLLKSIFLGTTNWLRSHRYETIDHSAPAVDDEGLLVDGLADDHPASSDRGGLSQRTMPVQAVTAVDRRDSVDKTHEGFNRLVDQLQKINDHLGRQLSQHDELMERVRQLPELLEAFPKIVDNQRELSGELLRQLQTAAARQEQFLNAVGQIPTETARQTRTLGAIHQQLETAAQTDAELMTCVTSVGRTLGHLDASTADNTVGMREMRKSAAARDRYLVYALSRFRRRIAWLFAGFAVLCVAAIAVLIGLILHVRP